MQSRERKVTDADSDTQEGAAISPRKRHCAPNSVDTAIAAAASLAAQQHANYLAQQALLALLQKDEELQVCAFCLVIT
jgi:hypothetical protein